MKDMLLGNVIEPARIEEMIPERLTELAHEVIQKSENLAGKLHPVALEQLTDVTQIMNAYYSNLIEGHNTRPHEIKEALSGDFSDDDEKRALQEEAVAHVHLQREIDQSARKGELEDPTTPDFILRLHKEFCKDLPEEFLWIRDANGNKQFKMVPGEFRKTEVAVGEHVAPPHEDIQQLLDYFNLRYGRQKMGSIAKVLAIPAAHHRFLFIHPYPDGNGRVARLMSHAMCLRAGIGAGGLWSISRGLARGLGGVVGQAQYKEHLKRADARRSSATDGRGVRSNSALIAFTEWFLQIMIDQIDFMGALYDFDTLNVRLERYAKLKDLHDTAPKLLRHILVNGEVPRGDVAGILGTSPRLSRVIMSEMLKDGIIGSATARGVLSLRFPPNEHDLLFPRLFIEA
ncbi:Fic family protein [uncultured Sulfitobacter sp.]|uniref:Fic family protein n=1 Tax=uncultured Sulfitobacter sp. TaxID=191468 RepID=UPI002602D3CA|nr:Fic family protein [uncultured Sulfitobacter sp.]